MNKKRNITAIILAGGKSSRMGTDKGFVSYKNKPFVQHIIDVIRPLVNEIIIISNNSNYDIFGLIRFEDLITNTGPLAGIYTGLHHSKTEYNLVISCDVPLISSEVIEKLIEQISDDVDVVQLQSNGREMPLIAIYKKQCEHLIKRKLNIGERRVREVLKQCKVKTVILEKELEVFTTNINTPTDLKNVL
ncbi:MAG: molybdenum cofactor guanylyltransferase [Flavobacteriaceae bacterium]|nr:molybdenum cofactor guanylyltransferase [Flavobacteriaceae bacterium]